jgi:hypothetical protein
MVTSYDRALRLLREHPEVKGDLRKLLDICIPVGKSGLISGEEAGMAGIRQSSLDLFIEYGVINKTPGEG